MYKVTTDKFCFHNGENPNTSLFIIDLHQGARKVKQFKKFEVMVIWGTGYIVHYSEQFSTFFPPKS